jgi:DHA3 family macrolide efflux protein-like MFS transporter
MPEDAQSYQEPSHEEPAPAAAGMRTFIIVWIGQAISIVGSSLTNFGLGVWIFQETGDATPFALTVLFGSLPRVFLLPVAGSLADRWNRRWLMILADTGNALATLAIVLLLYFGSLEVWHIYVLSVIGSALGTFQQPAYQASITMLVPKKHLARANGLVQTADSLGGILAPLLAGFLFVTIGLGGIVLIDFVTYFFAVLALLLVRIPQPKVGPSAEEEKGTVARDVRFAWRYLHQRPGLLGLLFYYASVNFFLSTVFVLSGPLLLSQHDADVYGLVQMVLGIGGLLGGLVASTWGGPQKHLIRAALGGIALYMVGIIVAGLRIHPAFPAFGLAFTVFVVSIVQSVSNAIWQMKVAPEVQGRVFSLRYMLATIITPLAYVAAGPLADQVFEPLMLEGGALASTALGTLLGTGPGRGIGLIYVLSGVLVILISAIAYLTPRISWLEEEVPDAVPAPAAP